MAGEMSKISRRRTLFVGAALLGSALASRAFAGPPVARWTGTALGAHATIEIVGLAEDEAAPLFRSIWHEVERLEAMFSLYRADSSISVLNREGVLREPSPEFLELMTIANVVHHRTGGLFDPTVQPLFAVYAEHFSRGVSTLPAWEAVSTALDLVGLDKVIVDADAIRLTRPGMGITLNGIAQGYVTDRVAELLRNAGLSNVLVDMGEIRAVGRGETGEGWRIGVRGDGDIVRRLTISEGAVATSMMMGTVIDERAKVGHILHPRLGLATAYNPLVTVVHESAAVADALSTAAVLLGESQLRDLRDQGVELYLG